MNPVRPQSTDKMAALADAFPAFISTITFGLVPRTSLVAIIDMIAMVVWVAISTLPIPGATPLRYALVGYFVLGVLRYPGQLLPAIVRAWPLFIIPIMCIISATWTPYSGDAIRRGVLLGLTGFFAIYLANRLTARQLLFAYFFIETVALFQSLATPNIMNGDATGIFGQKNYLAVHMFILYAAALAFIFDKEVQTPLRAIALAIAPLALYMILQSNSATTLIFVAAATVAFVGQALIWKPASKVRHMRVLIIMTVVLVAAIAFYGIFGLSSINLYDEFLGAMGKDSTLTGRTYLWDHAWRIIDEHPWTGLGANSYWRPELGEANSILYYFHYRHFVVFSFHNSYLEIGMQLGYPGMYALIFVALWALLLNVRNWVMQQDTTNTFFLVMAVLVVIRSNTEIDLVAEFSATMILLFIGAIRRNETAGTTVPAIPPTPPVMAPPRFAAVRNRS